MTILNKFKLQLIHALIFLLGIIFGAIGTAVEFEILYSYLQDWHLHLPFPAPDAPPFRAGEEGAVDISSNVM